MEHIKEFDAVIIKHVEHIREFDAVIIKHIWKGLAMITDLGK